MEYTLKTTKDDLYKKGFRYNKLMSDDSIDCYWLRFPVYQYKKSTILECELIVELQTGKAFINVFNYGTNDVYAPYYSREYGRYQILDAINETIEKQMKKLGAKEKK